MNLSTFLRTFCPSDTSKAAGKDTHRGLGAHWTPEQIERHLPAGFRAFDRNAQGDISWVSDAQTATITRSSTGDVVVICYHAFPSYRRALEGLRLYYQPRAVV